MDVTRHVPVMRAEVLRYLEPRPGRTIVDLTLGGAGHALALLEAGARVIGFDRDPAALERARARLSPHTDRFVPVHRDFGSMPGALDALGITSVDGVLMDLGLSSDQLDDPGRGFAHRLDGSLDLRFDRGQGRPAHAHLRGADRSTMAGWLREYGEVRRPGRLAERMAAAAARGELETTAQLRELVTELVPVQPEAELSRVFQALRILVNDELGQLDRALDALPERLHPGGRFVAISYHSLEDRRVKRMLRRASGRAPRPSRHLPLPEESAPSFVDLTGRALRPTAEEVALNPRARSARLRAGERR